MRYLITSSYLEFPFITNYFDCYYFFNPTIITVIYDLELLLFTTDGINWLPIPVSFFNP